MNANFELFLNNLTVSDAKAYRNSKEQLLFVTDLLTANNFSRSEEHIEKLETALELIVIS